ncbi:MAG TPA: cytochrome b [Candidatus Brocadiia bacterium]|nr:cytochrome bc complex cytochrome b subunit [Candidatus Brocadiales bacterium]
MSVAKKLYDWFEDRLGAVAIVSKFLKEPLPASVSWPYCLGSQALFLLIIQFVTGAFLGMNYSPSPEQAYQSVKYVTEEIPLGYIVRGLHHWSATFLVIVLVMHMLRIIFFGSYKKPRELTWIVGVMMFFIVLGFGFTGYLHPWDQKAYWATVVGTNIAGDVPVIGKYITRILRGGADVGTVALTRFYAVHVFFLPAMLVPLIIAHIYLMRRHGISSHFRIKEGTKEKTIPFFPDHAFKDAVVFSGVFIILVTVVLNIPAKLEEIANPTDTAYIPRPEWYFLFLFEMLKYFKGPFKVIGTVVIPAVGACILIALPFIDFRKERNPFKRPIVSSLTVVTLVLLIGLTILGGRKPPHEEEIAHVAMGSDCGRCHVQQQNMYLGIRDDGTPPVADPMAVAEMSCNIGCHRDLKAGHDVTVIRKNCVACHGAEYGQMFDDWQHAELESVEGIKAFIELLTVAEEKIITGEGKEEIRKAIKAEIDSATTIIDFVEKAKGIHNMNYSRALVANVKERLQTALQTLFEQLKAGSQPEA